MKKGFTVFLAVLLMFALASVSFAYSEVNLGTYEQGIEVSYRLDAAAGALAVTEYDSDGIAPADAPMPAGMYLQQVPVGDPATSFEYYIKGAPAVGSYTFVLSAVYADRTELITCHITVTAPAPVAPQTPTVVSCIDQTCFAGEKVTVSCEASVTDGGVLSYQWFSSVTPDITAGIPIQSAVSPSYVLTTSTPETAYFYCRVTNSLNGLAADTYSQPAKVTVKENGVKFLSVSQLPEKVMYTVGDKPDLTGLVLTVTYDNGSVITVSDLAEMTFEPAEFTVPNSQLVTVTYKGAQAGIPVAVQEFKEKIEILRMPVKLSYISGDVIDTAGLTLRVISREGYTDVTTGFTISPNVATRAGQQVITVIYSNGESAEFTVYVSNPKTEVRLELISKPTKLEYTVGDTLDITGTVLRVWSGDESRDISSGFTCSPSVFSKVTDKQVVTLQYGTNKVSFEVKVNEPEPEPTPTPAPVKTVAPVKTTPVVTTEPAAVKKTAPAAIVVIASVIAVAALAGAITYIIMLRKGGDDEEIDEAEEVTEEAPAEEGEEKPGIDPGKDDYFKDLFPGKK